jgi:hypothetical protein
VREAAEEASEQLARQGVRQAASKSFSSLDEALQTVTRERFESLPEKLFYYTDSETAHLIYASGRIGKDATSIVYLTPKGGLSPLQAQLKLALPSRNTAEVVISVPKSLLAPEKVLLIRRVTGNIYNRPGGGVEVLYKRPIYLQRP